MAWTMKGEPKTVAVTPKLAETYRDMEAVYTDRPLKQRRVDKYKQMVEEGKFRPALWARAYCKETKRWYRVNGKHVSTLFCDLNLKSYPNLRVTLEDYQCDTLADLADLYSTFDSAIQSRTATDVYVSFAATIPKLAHVTPRTLRLVVTALAFAKWPDNNGRGGNLTSQTDRAALLFDGVDDVLWLIPLLGPIGGSNDERCMQRAPVNGAMVLTYRKDCKAATAFWLAVKNNTGAEDMLPARRLHTHLIKTGLGGGSSHKKNLTTPRAHFVHCVRAWNAWRTGTVLDMNYSPEESLPEVV